MKIVNVAESGLDAVKKLLKKKAFDEVELDPKIRAANLKMLGREMTAGEIVEMIVSDVRQNGDAAIIKYARLIDKVDLTPADFLVSEAEFKAAKEEAEKDAAVVKAVKKAIHNVRRYHEAQKAQTWLTYRDYGSLLGQSVMPLERVGIYVPGGTAAYPSSVIMNAVPALVAGVDEIVMACPAVGGKINPLVLYTAELLGIQKIYKIGGAQAIAALAFGTETIQNVDKITGPGNIFVTLAKKAVYGHVDIDMLAGPSEILIIADETADPIYAAADMLSQAEHDRLASSIVITDCAALAEKIAASAEEQLAKLPRREITAASLENHGMIVVAENFAQCVELANVSAPEHMELLVKDPMSVLPLIRHAGAVFLGAYSPEPLGDYLAGPDHVLPTGGTARYYSCLNVETFLKRTSIIKYTKDALLQDADDIIAFAEAEGLQAHANAIRARQEK